MVDRTLNLEPGHERTIRHGPKPQGGWVRDGIITDKAPTRVIVTLGTAEPPPPSTGKTWNFGPLVEAAALQAAIADDSVDTILLRPGIYRLGKLSINSARTRPVLVRPESGGVTFDGDAGSAGQRIFASFKSAANITLKDVKITNYRPSGTGVIVLTDGAHDITFDGLDMTGNITATGNDHLIYPAGYSAACYDLTIQNCTLDGAKGGAIHIYHDPGATNVRVRNNRITNCTWGIIAAAQGATVIAEGNQFSGNRSNMLAYFQAPYFAKITASGNSPDDKITTSW